MITHGNYKMDCPVCKIPTINMLVKYSAKQKIKDFSCKNGHSFAVVVSGNGLKLFGIIEDLKS